MQLALFVVETIERERKPRMPRKVRLSLSTPLLDWREPLVEGEVRVIRMRVPCPRCGALSKFIEVAEGARGVRKFCDSCRRIDPDGEGRECGEVPRSGVKIEPPQIWRPEGMVVVWNDRATLDAAQLAARQWSDIVVVMAI